MAMRRSAVSAVRKRDGSIAEFDASKIERAIQRAALETLQDRERAERIAQRVTRLVTESLAGRYKNRTPGVEEIQDIIEATLMSWIQSHRQRLHPLSGEPLSSPPGQIRPWIEGRPEAAGQRDRGAPAAIPAQG